MGSWANGKKGNGLKVVIEASKEGAKVGRVKEVADRCDLGAYIEKQKELVQADY